MTAILVVLCIVLIGIIVVQIGKVTELAGKIRGEEEAQERSNRTQAGYQILFLIVFLGLSFWSAFYYKDTMLWYGPNESASAHGGSIDYIFNITLFFTGIVFVITQVLLFYFAYSYRARRGHKAMFVSHNNKLELVWTAIPAVVMTFLVVGGLDAWNDVMADVDPDEEYIEIEATGYQFAWHLRYPGPDEKLGARDYKLISAKNPLGQVWTDEKNHDDFHPSEIVLPVNKQVRVRITARDVLHNFYLPHFRVKMDAVPGMPTYFVFTPTITTEEYRAKLGALDENGEPMYPEWHQPADPADPEGPTKYELFDYELACAELCGSGHYSMRRAVRIVSEAEYEQWLTEQQSYYESTIKGTDADPLAEEVTEEAPAYQELDIDEGMAPQEIIEDEPAVSE